MSEDINSIKSRSTRIASLVRKELSTLFKDKMSMFILFIIPIVIFVVVGAGKPAIGDDLTVRLYVIDYDDTPLSHQFIESLNKTTVLTSNWDVEDSMTRDEFLAYAKKILPTNELSAYLIIPEGFQEEMLVNQSTSVEVHIDAIDFITLLLSKGMIEFGMVYYQLNNFVFSSEVFYFPEMRPELDFSNLLQIGAPMIVGIVLFSTMNMVSTQCIVGDIPLKRLLTTPIFRSEVVVGKTIAYSIVGVFQIIITMILLKIFNVPMNGLFIDIFLILWLCSMSGITMGIFYSAISKTRLQAAQMYLFGFMIMIIITMVLRSPLILPFLPLEQAQISFSNLAYRGDTLEDIYLNVLYLLFDAIIFFIITIIYLKHKREFI